MSSKIKHRFLIIFIIAVVLAALFLFWPQKSLAPVSGDTPASLLLQTAGSANSSSQIQSDNQTLRATVMMYHHIGPLPERADSIRKGLTVSAEEFEAQIKYLFENGYKMISLAKLDSYLQKKKIPEKLVIITFDDGYDDNFTYALPVLKKYNVTGTFFIITNKIGKNEYMSEDQIKELISSGNEIGSHSYSHISLDTAKGQTLEREVVQSKSDLEKIIGKAVISFCYPAGKYTDATVAKVKDAGYKYAVTTVSSTGMIDLTKPFEIPRFRISTGRNIEVLLK